jgi:DNA polymerase III subunit epsilon
MKLKRTFVWAGALASLFFITGGALLVAVVIHRLPPDLSEAAFEIIGDHLFYIGAVAFVAMFVATFLFEGMFQHFVLPIYRLAEEISLINSANPSYRIKPSGNKHYMGLAKALNDWADQYQDMRNSVEERILRAGEKIENEKNILASVISELPEGIVICSAQGQTLLFNKRAREFLERDSDPRAPDTQSPVPGGRMGLGRPIFEAIDKNLIIHGLEDIGEKMRKNAPDITSAFVTPGKNQALCRVEIVPILKLKNRLYGFILIIDNIAGQLKTDRGLSLKFQSFRRDIRASIAGLRSAMEVILEYPDMEKKRRNGFLDIIKNGFDKINENLDSEILEYSRAFHHQRKLVSMSAESLLESLGHKLEKRLQVSVEIDGCEDGCWTRIDTYTLILALMCLIRHIKHEARTDHFSWTARKRGRFVNLDLFWRGNPVTMEKLRQWEDEALSLKDESIPLTLGEVMEYHEGKIWPYSPGPESEKSHLRIVLPLEQAPDRDRPGHKPVLYEGRPEFYDFDLFNQPGQTPELDDRPLASLNFTVFDTETTGLDPSGGDEIISIGGFRIVNSRILKTDYFDELVDPRRPIPWESVKIHGIYPEMLNGKPTVAKVLPIFREFVGDTILIAHNAAFDMKMLQMKEGATGIKFINPTLDTMLLSAVLHPAQEDHTLEAISERLGVSIVGRHTALGDALATGELFLKMLPLLSAMGIHTLKEALIASRKKYYSRIDFF